MITRRKAFQTALAAASGASFLLKSADAGEGSPRLIYRQREPDNLETDFSGIRSLITPNESFYVRSHFATPPELNPTSWKLTVEGAVERSLDWGLNDLAGLPQQTRVAVMECAGNGRVFLTPAAGGVQWELGGVGNAEWKGVRLSDVLAKAGVKGSAVEILFEGADKGGVANTPKPVEPITFARSLPLKKALADEVLLVTQMNGEPLPMSHGGPLRLLVPGYYGMASVKWLKRIVAIEKPFTGYFQTVDYAVWGKLGDEPVRQPLYEMTVKSEIARPVVGETVASGKTYKVAGMAWTGDAEVTNVEFSPDGGRTWVPTKLTSEAKRFTWRSWECDWTPQQSGKQVLMSRATDSRGNVQPSAHDGNNGAYVIHHTLPIYVFVT